MAGARFVKSMAPRGPVTVLAILVAGLITAGQPPTAAHASNEANVSAGSGLIGIDAPQTLTAGGHAEANVIASSDYPLATWVPAALTNYTVASRPDDYPIELIVIHDIEGTPSSAITAFQNPLRHGSAHYIVSNKGQVWQMVAEKDVAWHAGNWDYNTRSIGIEHEGYAWTPGLYTTAEYRASAHIAASICSRYGVPLDRAHVIGHNQVPDPYHAGLFGGDSHHTDPGPYWNWTYYLGYANLYALLLPSAPHMMVDPVAVPDDKSATVTWRPAQTCHNPITGYHVLMQPGNFTKDLPGTATTWTFDHLQNGTSYSFTVTATNSEGDSTRQSGSVIAGPHCATAELASDVTSPQVLGSQLRLTATSTGCPNATYAFFLRYPNGRWYNGRLFGGPTWTWDTLLYPKGTYMIRLVANQSGDTANPEVIVNQTFSLTEPPPCTSVGVTPGTVIQPAGSTVSFTARATGCPITLYKYWVRYPNGSWAILRNFSTNPILNWNTIGLAPGKYKVDVWATHPGHSLTSVEVYGLSYVTLTGCTSATLSPALTSSAVGSPVVFTASSGGCPNPVYQFWLKDTLAKWHLMRAFSTSATWTWDTTSWAKGTYQIVVWASQQGAFTGRAEAYRSTTHTLI
jgi:N-acetylmuramoyl-L-alanine amidase/Fibronectin type III domain